MKKNTIIITTITRYYPKNRTQNWTWDAEQHNQNTLRVLHVLQCERSPPTTDLNDQIYLTSQERLPIQVQSPRYMLGYTVKGRRAVSRVSCVIEIEWCGLQ